ncbi:MAG: TetM/TetW/TetO/TetS family tetracycline resistance ribosomal protection protein [Eubacteriaceae bacterium]|nr:TetM/TetW/TetO/TetS family tetracycline resistance ribosomal protection protein [Eubacteriaceae bacterium]
MNNKEFLTFGIVAHVDSGKTTLSEAILYETGTTRTMGRVDHGDAFLDTYDLEKKRGITIFSKQAVFSLGNSTVTWLDTPGHMDFSAEMERTLCVLDYAVLVISGPNGITGQDETLWKILDNYKVPTFIFINKMDQPGCDINMIMERLQGKLSKSCLLFDVENDEFFDNLAMSDEDILNEFLDTGAVSEEKIIKAIKSRKIIPCFSGSALKMIGIREFLQGLERYTESTKYNIEGDFCAKVFKISRDDKGNRLSHMKVLHGTATVKEIIDEEKINQIRLYNGAKYEMISEARAGQIIAVTGLDKTYSGQEIGSENRGNKPVIDSVLSYQILLPDGYDVHDAHHKLSILSEEIPELHVGWDEGSGTIHMNLMGEVQAEIVKSIVHQRFGLTIDFTQGKVMYKETIEGKSYGIGHYEPLRHYAEVHLILEGLPEGSGLVFDSICSEDVLDRNWQRLIMTHLHERLHPGVLTGAPVTDMRISIATGKAHVKHTEGGDFRQATYRAVRNGLRRAKNILLEPFYSYTLELPTELVGRAMSDIQRMSGTCSPETQNGNGITTLTGICPVATMNGYQKELVSYSKGIGRLTCVFDGYKPCHNQEQIIAEADYNPDTDAENPTGSIFCSHGGGTFIPWDEVEKYMHLEPVITDKREFDDMTVALTGNTNREYSQAELDAVFQMTYGTSKREQNRFKRSAHVVESNFSGPKVQSGYNKSNAEEILIIDGYNIIFAWDELKDMCKLNLEAARDSLIDMLRNYHGYTGQRIILVFDAYKQPGSIGHTDVFEGLSVVYTKENETADRYIEKFVTENAKKYKLTVATSDGLEQMMIFGQGALRMPARELRERIRSFNNGRN